MSAGEKMADVGLIRGRASKGARYPTALGHAGHSKWLADVRK